MRNAAVRETKVVTEVAKMLEESAAGGTYSFRSSFAFNDSFCSSFSSITPSSVLLSSFVSPSSASLDSSSTTGGSIVTRRLPDWSCCRVRMADVVLISQPISNSSPTGSIKS